MKVNITRVSNQTGKYLYTQAIINCPGCNEYHHPIIEKDEDEQYPVWGFNNDIEKPTFTPSLLVKYPMAGVDVICHSFITDGKIQFLGDCTHELANQTVEIPEVEL